MDLLRRHLAPISADAWEEIDEQATISLKQFLSARQVIDVEGPKGWDFSALATGRMSLSNDNKGVSYGVRESLPVVEPRVSFTLNKWELDNISRGVEDVDLEPLEEAAKKIAFFEENIIYNGFKKHGITGLFDAEHEAEKLPKDNSQWPDSIVKAVYKLREAAIDGPYALVLSPKLWQGFNYLTSCGCSKRAQLESIIGGPVILSHFLKDGLLVTLQGGDYVMSLGSDFCIGYESSTKEEVTLYLTESFTFKMLEPNGVIPIKAG